MQDFESWMRGELQRQNRKLYQTEGATDFRKRISRPIWPSKLGLSGYRILPARGIYRLAEKFVFCCIFLPAGVGLSFAGNIPFSLRFETLHLSGASVLSKTRKQRSAFSNTLQRGCVSG